MNHVECVADEGGGLNVRIDGANSKESTEPRTIRDVVDVGWVDFVFS